MAEVEKKEEQKPNDEPPKNDRRDVDVVVSELVSKYGSERAALRVLADQQLDYRRDRRELAAKLPKEGERVLAVADAKEYDAFKALGKSPKDITTALEQNTSLTQELDAMKVEKVIAEAAQIAGYKPSVLTKLAKTEGFRVEVREEGKGDDKKKVAYAVKGEGEEAEESELTEFATQALADFLPSLAVESGTPQKSSTAPSGQIPTQPPRGTAPAPRNTVEHLKEAKRATGAYVA